MVECNEVICAWCDASVNGLHRAHECSVAAFMSLQLIAPRVWRSNIFNFVNAYFIQNSDGDFVLVDTGVKPASAGLKAAAMELGQPPIAIVLTHGHLDHAGSAGDLAQAWDVPVFAGRLEKPFLTGQDFYPPPDPTVGGALAQVARLLPPQKQDLSDALELLPSDGKLDVLKGWRIIETPGHSPGHVSLWHEDDRVLLAGDALCTADMDTILGLSTLKPTQFARGRLAVRARLERDEAFARTVGRFGTIHRCGGPRDPDDGRRCAAKTTRFLPRFHAAIARSLRRRSGAKRRNRSHIFAARAARSIAAQCGDWRNSGRCGLCDSGPLTQMRPAKRCDTKSHRVHRERSREDARTGATSSRTSVLFVSQLSGVSDDAHSWIPPLATPPREARANGVRAKIGRPCSPSKSRQVQP